MPSMIQKFGEECREKGFGPAMQKGAKKCVYTAVVGFDRLFDRVLKIGFFSDMMKNVGTKYSQSFAREQNISDSDYKKYVEVQITKSFKNSSYLRFWRFWGRTGLIEKLNDILPKDRSGLSILCVGCRDGRELNNVRKICGITNITGLDLFSQDSRIKVGDMHGMPFTDGMFDMLISVDNLEHAYEPQKALSEFRRVVKKGGLIGIEVPVNYQTNETDRHDYKSIENLSKLAGFDYPQSIVFSEESQAPVYQKIRAIFKNA